MVTSENKQDFQEACEFIDEEFNLTTDYEHYDELKPRINRKFAQNNIETTLHYILRRSDERNGNRALRRLLIKYTRVHGADELLNTLQSVSDKYQFNGKDRGAVYMDANSFDSLFTPEEEQNENVEGTDFRYLEFEELKNFNPPNISTYNRGIRQAVSRTMFSDFNKSEMDIKEFKRGHPIHQMDSRTDILYDILMDKMNDSHIVHSVQDTGGFLSFIESEYHDQYNQMLTWFLLHRAVLEDENVVIDRAEHNDVLFKRFLTLSNNESDDDDSDEYKRLDKDSRYELTKAVVEYKGKADILRRYFEIREENETERWEKVDEKLDNLLR